MTTVDTTISQGGLLPSTSYTVWVRGIDSAGNPSDWSQAFPFTTVRDNVAPGDPTSISADFTTSSVIVTWSPPNNVPADFQDYQITFSKSDGTSPVSFFTVNPRYTFTFQDNANAFTTPQSIVNVVVKSRDKSGNISAGTTDGSFANSVTNLAPTAVPTISVSPLVGSYSVQITSTNAPADSAGVEILQHTALTGGTTTSKWKGTDSIAAITATAGTKVWVSARYVDVFGQAGPETSPRVDVTPTNPLNFDTTPPAAPTSLNLTTASDTADPTGSTGIVTLAWTAPSDSDLAGYQISYGPASNDLTRLLNVGKVTTVKIDKLSSGVTYYFSIKSVDVAGNVSAGALTGNILLPVDGSAPGKPASPSASRNNTKIVINHSLYLANGTTRLPVDTAYLDFHIGDSSTFNISYDATVNPYTFFVRAPVNIPAGSATSYTGSFDYPDGATTLANKYIKVVAVDKSGNPSSGSDGASISTTLTSPIFAPSITVGDAQIGSLSATKLVTDTAIANNLKVTSTLTVGDTNNDGYIQSFDWASGTKGWRIGYNGSNYDLEINNGTIRAAALLLQSSVNLLRMEHSVFNRLNSGDIYFGTGGTSAPSLSITSGITGSTIQDTTANPAGSWALKLVSDATASPYIGFLPMEEVIPSTTPATYEKKPYIPTETATYILSGWFKADSGTPAISLSLWDGTTQYPTSPTTQNASTTWTRMTWTVSMTTATSVALRLNIPSSTTMYVKGLQVEKAVTSLTTASNYVIPGGTTINGSSIKTGSIRSSNYVSGNSGWGIDLNGNSEFNNVTVRGNITANAGFIGGAYGWKIEDNLISNNNVGIYAPRVSTRTNLIVNPTFDGATTATTFWTTTNATAALDSTKQYSGISSLKLTASGTSTMSISSPTGTSGMPVTPSTPYVASIYANATSTTSRNISMNITWYNSLGNVISTTTAVSAAIVSTDGWKRFSTGVQISPASSAFASVSISYVTPAISDVVNFDAALFENSAILDTYFDGSYSGAKWASAISNSTSSITNSTDGKLRYNYSINPSFELDLSATTSGTGVGGTMTYTVAGGHGLTVGATYFAQVYGSSVGGYNGPFTLTAATATTLTTSGSATGASTGTKILIGWQTYNTGTTVAQSTTTPFVGTRKLLVTSVTGANTTDSGIITKFTPEQGSTYTASAYFRADNFTDTASATIAIQFVWPDATTSTPSTATIYQRDGWVRLSHTATAPVVTTGQATVRFFTIYKGGVSSTAPGNVSVDAALIEKSYVANPYFDGSSIGGGSWSSVAHASESQLYETTFYAGSVDRANSPFMVKYDGSIFATKGRIGADLSNAWNISSDGIFYENPTTTIYNLLYSYDPSFESGTGLGSYWVASGTVTPGTNGSITAEQTSVYSNATTGVNSIRIGLSNDNQGVAETASSMKLSMYKSNGATPTKFPISDFGFTAGSTTIAFSAYVRAISATASPTATVTAYYYNGAAPNGSLASAATTINTSSFTKITITGTVPANTTDIYFEIAATNQASNTGNNSFPKTWAFAVDKVSLATGSTTSESDIANAYSTYLRSNQLLNPLEIKQAGITKFSVGQTGSLYSTGIIADLITSNTSITSPLITSGTASATLLKITPNRIQATKNSSNSTLYLNDNGGNVVIGGAVADTTVISQSIYNNVVSARAVNISSANGGTMGTPASTRRVKSFIENVFDEINSSNVLNLDLVRFKYNSEINQYGDSAPYHLGFIAEQAQELGLEHLYLTDEQGIPDYFAYEKLSLYLFAKIKDQSSKIKDLESRLAALENK